MDREQEEMQFLGLFGIYAEAYKLIFRYRKIFSQITLSLILPLSLILLGHEEISDILYRKIGSTQHSPRSTPRDNSFSNIVSSEWAIYTLSRAPYFTFLLVFSLLSTSAVVYTVASVYTSRKITFKNVMSIVPKVWKRLMVTFLCTFFAFFAYNMIFGITLVMWLFSTVSETEIIGPTILWVILVSYPIGFIYMTIIWQLASVVSVLEDSCGFKAMIKSKNLIKGKIMVALVIFLKLNLSLIAIADAFSRCVVYGGTEFGALMLSIGIGALCLLLLCKLILFALVVQTVIYFVCKSYHHENIDKTALSDHLEVYILGDYVPLKAKDVQLEEYRV